jgi:tRNA nucleotidyltransferase (CCA-adding enzyme)
VETSLIRQDLFRRDFTINALAVNLAGERHGELVDFFGGRKDLQRHEIRVLHSLSFIDDPTRAIRAVRYARRLGFSIAADTRNLIATAISEGVFDRLSGQRLRRELQMLLSEPHPTPAVALLAELGLLPVISPDFVWNETTRRFLLETESQRAWYQLQQLGPAADSWLLYLGALVVQSAEGAADRLAERLQLVGELARRMSELPSLVQDIVAAANNVGLSPAQRMHRIDGRKCEPILLAMASVDMEARRRLAAAIEASATAILPVNGAQLVEAGIQPGPNIGRALAAARDALVDGEISAAEAFDFALEAAKNRAVEDAR